MKLKMRRVMLFVPDVEEVGAFYANKLGLKILHSEKGFMDLDAGACRLGLHGSKDAKPGRTKLCFYSDNVSATRALLIERGVKMGVDRGVVNGLHICDGRDPAGNTFQISNRE